MYASNFLPVKLSEKYRDDGARVNNTDLRDQISDFVTLASQRDKACLIFVTDQLQDRSSGSHTKALPNRSIHFRDCIARSRNYD